MIMFSQTSCPRAPSQQRGAASLLISLVILALITVVTLYTSKSLLTEQKLANNDYRSKRAFEAAEAGLGAAITNLTAARDLNANGVLDGAAADPNIFDSNGDNIRDTNTLAVGSGSGSVTVSAADLSTNQTIIRLIATGYNDDRSAMRTITRIISAVKPLPNNMDNPLTTKGTVIISGSATVHNQEGHSTIWSGGNVDLGANNATATLIADVNDPNYPTCMDTAATCGTIQSSNKTLVGLDVIENDSNLARLTADQLFQNFFGTSKVNYQEKVVTLTTTPGAAAADLNNVTGETIWIDGSSGPTTLNGATIGSMDKPVILIVDGDISFSGNTHIYGVVFVVGAFSASGNSTFQGAVVAAGPMTNTNGSLDIWYNSDLLNKTAANGKLGSSAGSWSDI